MVRFFNLLLLLALSAEAKCSDYYLLGSKHTNFSQHLQTKNTIIWDNSGSNWSVSKPLNQVDPSKYTCKDSGYLLVNDNTISYAKKIHTKKNYMLKQGWNYVAGYKDGVDVWKTFETYPEVLFVYVYDKPTEAWAGYSPHRNLRKKMATTRILNLKYIEPGVGFYVYATKKSHIKIEANGINARCKKVLEDKKFDTLTDSGLTKEMVYNKEKTVGLKSRYTAHYKRGIYDDSRVTLIYPKMQVKLKRTLRYGPAVPKTLIEFSKEYQGAKVYMYDYKFQKCYQGYLPSTKRPPLATFKELQ